MALFNPLDSDLGSNQDHCNTINLPRQDLLQMTFGEQLADLFSYPPLVPTTGGTDTPSRPAIMAWTVTRPLCMRDELKVKPMLVKSPFQCYLSELGEELGRLMGNRRYATGLKQANLDAGAKHFVSHIFSSLRLMMWNMLWHHLASHPGYVLGEAVAFFQQTLGIQFNLPHDGLPISLGATFPHFKFEPLNPTLMAHFMVVYGLWPRPDGSFVSLIDGLMGRSWSRVLAQAGRNYEEEVDLRQLWTTYRKYGIIQILQIPVVKSADDPPLPISGPRQQVYAPSQGLFLGSFGQRSLLRKHSRFQSWSQMTIDPFGCGAAHILVTPRDNVMSILPYNFGTEVITNQVKKIMRTLSTEPNSRFCAETFVGLPEMTYKPVSFDNSWEPHA